MVVMESMTSLPLAVCFLLHILQLPSPGDATATVKVQLVTFKNPNNRDWHGENCDLFFNTKCDNIFTFCLDKKTGDDDVSHCLYGRFTSGEFANMEEITFDHDVRGVANPIERRLDRWQGLKLKVRVVDDDSSHSGADLVDSYSHTYHGPAGMNDTYGQSVMSVIRGKRTRTQPTSLTVTFSVKCDRYFYGSDCTRRCRYRDNGRGHFTCDENGFRMCLPGWENLSNDCLDWSDDCRGHQCKNGATCVDGVREYTCACAVGYTGNRCQQDINDCSPNPCQHGAQCVDQVAGYECVCPPEYPTQLSPTCNIHTCNGTDPCLNGATCYGDSKCKCPPNYTGERCELHYCESNCVFCQNGGTCNGTACFCPEGTLGASCEVALCDHMTCFNGGKCDNGACFCAAGYTGRYCHMNIDDCASFPCKNGGTCIDGQGNYTCVCVKEYTGRNCWLSVEKETPKPTKPTQRPNEVNRKEYLTDGPNVKPITKVVSQSMFVALIIVIVLLIIIIIILLVVVFCDRMKRRRAKATENGTLPTGNYDNPLYTIPAARAAAAETSRYDDSSYLRPMGAEGGGTVDFIAAEKNGIPGIEPHYQVPPGQRGRGDAVYDRPRPLADLQHPPPYSSRIEPGPVSMSDIKASLAEDPDYEDLNTFSKTPLP